MDTTITRLEQQSPSPVLDKAGLAARWGLCRRTINNLMRVGLPHVRIGSRRTRFLIPECDRWMVDTFGVRRLGPANPVVHTPVAGQDEEGGHA